MLKPICVKCERFYRAKKTGFYFIESMPKGGHLGAVKPGRAEPDAWRPYKVWSGDLWKCPDCGHELISGTGMSALAERHYPDFEATIERTGARRLEVKDC